ncbi:MAG: N-formylglutamate amidohydrolase [Pseudomonadota bacterium]
MLAPDEPDPVGHVPGDQISPFLLLCDHAGRLVPRKLGNLGAPAGEFDRHTAYDIGALGVATRLSERLGAELIFQRYSRLVIDCNRPPHVPSAFVKRADGSPIKANQALTATDAAARCAEIFHPYHSAIEAALARRQASVIVAVHSFTPKHTELPGPRPWHVGLLFNRFDGLAMALQDALASDPSLTIGMNEPYKVSDNDDYAIPVHAERTGRAHVEIEVRQDLILEAEGQMAWGDRLADALVAALAVMDRSNTASPVAAAKLQSGAPQ